MTVLYQSSINIWIQYAVRVFQGVAVDVEIAKKKGLKKDQLEKESPDEHQPLSNILVLIIMIATASGICVCVYHVALRISRLEQRVDVMSHPCSSSVQLLTATARPIADRRHHTSEVSTTLSAPSTTSFARTSSPISDQRGTEDDDDEERQTYDNTGVPGGLEDDDEDTEEFSGDESSGELYDSPQRYKFIDSWSRFSSYDNYFHTGRRKRSVLDLPISVAAPGSGRGRRQHQHQHQQQQQHGRRRTGHRTTSNPADSSRQNPRTPGDDRRRERKRQGRRRPRAHTDVVDGQFVHVWLTYLQ